jgi:hypothetical protein
MDIRDTRKLLARMKEDSDMIRRIIEKETSDARMIVEHDVHREIADALLSIGNDIEIAESKWRYFGMVGFGAKKMMVIQK